MKPWRPGAPLKDVVPPAANLGDPLPPESMALREEIRNEEGMRRVRKMLSAPALPTSREDEVAVSQLIRRRRNRGPKRKLSFSKQDSECLMRIERMLVELLKQSET